MPRSKVWLSCVVFMTCLFAVAQDNQTSVPKSDGAKSPTGTVYVYRYKQYVGSALEPMVYCDDAEMAKMDNGRYFALLLDAGKHTIRSNDKQSGIELNVMPGGVYFIRVEIATGLLKGHGRLILTAHEQATYELASKKLKPLDIGKVIDKTRVSIEVADLQKPTPAAAPAPAPAPAAAPANSAATPTAKALLPSAPMPQAETPMGQQNSVHGVVSNDSSPSATSQLGEPMSVAEAARRAREKKQNQK